MGLGMGAHGPYLEVGVFQENGLELLGRAGTAPARIKRRWINARCKR